MTATAVLCCQNSNMSPCASSAKLGVEVRYSLRHIHLLVVVVRHIGCCVDVDCIGRAEEHRHMKESVRSVEPREMT